MISSSMDRAVNAQIISALLPGTFDSDASGSPLWNHDLLASNRVVTIEPRQVITYEINPKAAWDDGTPITWEDFLWEWRACNGTDKQYQIGSSNGYEPIEKVDGRHRPRGPRDVQAALLRLAGGVQPAHAGVDQPRSTDFQRRLEGQTAADGWTVQAGIDQRHVEDGDGRQEREVVGTPAKLDRIVYRIIDPDAQIDAIANGEIDAMDIGPDANKFARARDIEGTDLRFAGGPNFRHLTMNGTGAILKDVRVRKALAMAISRQAIARRPAGPARHQGGAARTITFS